MTTPPGWSEARLEDVAEVRLGRQRSPDKAHGDNLVPYLRAANVRWGGLDLSDVKSMQFSLEEVETFRLRRDDILVVEASGSRDEVGKSALWREELPLVCLQNTLIRVRSRGVDAPFLRWHLHQDAATGDLGGASKGIGIHHIGAGRLADWLIRVPPLNEQRRIVAKLDAVFEQTRTAKARIERLPALLERLKRSILAAAFRGDLTKDWRAAHPHVEPASVLLERIRAERRRRWEDGLRARGKDPKKTKYTEPDPADRESLDELPPGWTWSSVGEFSVFVTDGEHATPPRTTAGVPLLSARNIRDGRLDLRDQDWISAETHEQHARRLRIQVGDVLLSCSGSVGRSCVVPPDLEFSLVRSVAVIRPLFNAGHFVSLCLRSPALQQQINDSKTETAQANIFQGKIVRLALPVAPEAERIEIEARLGQALAQVELLHETVKRADERATQLGPTILAKAFRGELVPQDPTDEPASLLLDRIRGARAAEPARPRRGRGQRTDAGPATEVATPTSSNGHATNGRHDDSIDLVVGAFQVDRRLTVSAITDATGLDISAVKKALKILLDSGQLRVNGRARAATYEWSP